MKCDAKLLVSQKSYTFKAQYSLFQVILNLFIQKLKLKIYNTDGMIKHF